METRHLLLAFVLLTHTLTTGLWWTAGTWMGLSSRAARYWLIATLGNGVGLCLMLIPGSGPAMLRVLTACSLAALGAIWLRQGLQVFLKLPRAETRQLVLSMALMVFNILVCVPLGWQAAGVAVSAGVVAATMLWSVREAFHPLRQEFNPGTAWTAAVMFGVVALCAMLTGLSQLRPDWPWPWLQSPLDTRQFVLTFVSVTLSILTSFVLGYIVVMRLVARLEHLSQHDGLTGLLNRRAIEALLDREAQRLERFNQPFSILLIDIDHFKRVNDRLGHPAGDQVLIEVARRLQVEAREVDHVARYGGEEFCVLLPHTEHEGALQAAERLREGVCERPITWGNATVPVTISMGLVCANDPRESLQSLLRRADAALYQAKDGGRNMVVSAPTKDDSATPDATQA
ncbi:MAG: GGDEF domain-containing protein [Aquabacterium sp.]|nr:GGDEF domain-containing protein [Aquabacterium sp.]